MKKYINSKIKCILPMFLVLYLKSFLFISISSSNSARNIGLFQLDFSNMIPHLALLGVIIFPAMFFRGKGIFKYLVFIDLIYSLLLIVDLWYFRASGYFLDVSYMFFKDLFNPFNNSLINPSSLDLLFIIDIPILVYLIIKIRIKIEDNRNVIKGMIGISLSILLVASWHYLFDIKKVEGGGGMRFMQKDWQVSYNPATKALNRSPIGNKLYETYLTFQKINKEVNNEEIYKVSDWLKWNNEDLPDNEYKGIAKDKNVVFLQIESLEDFLINRKVYDQDITPNLNKYVNEEGLYFSNIYEQNNAGNSIDADMMVNTGLLTLGDEITFLSYPEVKYNSLSRVLGNYGYTSVSTHAEKTGDWNWGLAHKNALGFDDIWDVNDYSIDEYVGFGLSDKSFYTQYVEKISKLKEPFYSVISTLSSHGPFDIGKEYRELDLPKELDDNKLGGYFQSIYYADKQIGMFIELLEKYDLIDNTMVVIYGDHGGIHKYYMEDVEATNMDGDWWKEYERQIPLIIIGDGIPNKTIETIGGHIDILPTVSYLLGADTKNTAMGRNLLNTKRNSTVIKGGTIIGNPNQEELEKLSEGYKIAEYIIKNNYFEVKDKIK
ncbi:LTA synthase family protein [Clostridium sp.]|uniref:LTA synthase family protein n=1 Tax=Clostridium sp. TaxID=1506 RepID=UPI002620F4D1|nr:LTA synthase family protein [Clostridium sp.]